MASAVELVPGRIGQRQLAQWLVEAAVGVGIELVGSGGLLFGLTRVVLEAALEVGMSEHLGYDRGDPAGRGGGNLRKGNRAKTVLSEVGRVQIGRVADGSRLESRKITVM